MNFAKLFALKVVFFVNFRVKMQTTKEYLEIVVTYDHRIELASILPLLCCFRDEEILFNLSTTSCAKSPPKSRRKNMKTKGDSREQMYIV